MPEITKTEGKGKKWATAGKRWRTRVLVGLAGVTAATAVLTYNTDINDYAFLDDSGGGTNVPYNKHAQVTDIDTLASGIYGPFQSNDITCEFSTSGTCPASGNDNRPDNGPGAGAAPFQQGSFRITCDVSHFAHDDPILKYNEPGHSHLHMFFGNTEVNADTVFNGLPGNPSDPHDIMNTGGGSCQSNVGNRSAYWMPALYSGGEGPNRKIAKPDSITLYYKSRYAEQVQILPPGVQLLGGNIDGSGLNPGLGQARWGCNDGSSSVNVGNTIPVSCPAAYQDLIAVIDFPACLQTDNGTATGNPVLTSPDHVSHTAIYNDQFACPASHPYRVPQIQYLVRWDTTRYTAAEQAAFRLSSDTDFEKPVAVNPGSTLHGDWLGGWHPDIIQSWIDGCFDPDTDPAGGIFTNEGVNNFGGPRNCSGGQTGTNAHWFATGGDLAGTKGTGEARNFLRISSLGKTSNPGLHDDPCDFCKPIPE